MKILYLISEYPKVSHSFVRREIQALSDLGHQVTRVAIRGWDLPLADPADRAERALTRYVLQAGLPALLWAALWALCNRPSRWVEAWRAMWRMSKRADRSLPYHVIYLLEACWIARQIRDERMDHLHAHFGTNPAEVAALVSALTGLPFSFTAHGPDEFDRPEALHLREKVARSKFVVTVSSFGRSQMLRWVRHEDWHKVKVVHCGVDSAFLAEALTPVPDTDRVVCVGRLSGQKGQLLLLEAVARLQAAGTPVHLVLAGDGEMRSEVEAAIQRLGIKALVTITGWISGAQVKDEILKSRAMVLPSFAEGLPVVIMETMALGRPVLSTYIAGIPELVRPDHNGWLCPAGQVDELAQAMTELLQAPLDRLNEMGQSNRVRARERHDVVTEANRLLTHMQG